MTKLSLPSASPQRFDVKAVDPDQSEGDVLSYAWERNGRPVANADGGEWVLPAPEDGDQVQVTVRDKSGATASRSWRVAILVPKENHPPRIVSASPSDRRVSVEEGGVVSFALNAEDPDAGDHLTYRWTVDGRPSGQASTFRLGPPNTKAGEAQTVEVEVSDKDGAKTAAVTWRIDVEPGPPRIVEAEPRRPEIEQASGQGTTFSARGASSRDGAKLKYEWSIDDRTISGETAERLTLLHDLAAGRHRVQVVAIDERQRRSEAHQWSVLVRETPPPPPPPPPVVVTPTTQPPSRPAGGTAITEQDVQSWLARYRSAWSNQDTAALQDIGGASDAQLRAIEATKGGGKGYRMAVRTQRESVKIDGATAVVTFERVDHPEDGGRELVHPGALTFHLERRGGSVVAVR